MATFCVWCLAQVPVLRHLGLFCVGCNRMFGRGESAIGYSQAVGMHDAPGDARRCMALDRACGLLNACERDKVEIVAWVCLQWHA